MFKDLITANQLQDLFILQMCDLITIYQRLEQPDSDFEDSFLIDFQFADLKMTAVDWNNEDGLTSVDMNFGFSKPIENLIAKYKSKLNPETRRKDASIECLRILLQLISLDPDLILFSTYNDKTKSYDNDWKPYFIINDTFGYACADAEGFDPTNENELSLILQLYRDFGYSGIVAWCSIKRDCQPLDNFVDNKFKKALKFLKTKEHV